jgi:hydroxyacyl-ACP dehydratase HTD2-like protein with hotdog domain
MTLLSAQAIATANVGDTIAELVREPTMVQLFEFSAVTWNAHRIHYDRDYARDVEGYPDVLVQSHLHACFLSQAVMDACGPGGRLTRIGWQNRGMAVPGDRLTVSGTVTDVQRDNGSVTVEFALEERNQRDELCVKGWATAVLQIGWD